MDGSAALREASPDLMAAVLARHDRTIEEAARAHGGELIRAPAHRPDEPWPTPRPIAIQTGIHTGEAELRDGQYIGPVVERCARLCSIGHGDQILLSEVAAGLLRTIRRPAPACDS